jgi:YkoY family integral membrane protein
VIDFLHSILGPDLSAAGMIILNLLLIESLLSVDNAAVLATMVMDLPKEERSKALKYGIIGAYVFRGLCLVFVSYLVSISWLKLLGGLYLLWIVIAYFRKKASKTNEEEKADKKENKIYKYTFGLLGQFWATVALVEVMDLAFSIDNVFAAVAYVENYPKPYSLCLVCIGVFIGILAMRFVTQGFVKLMEKFSFLETSAFVVIAILGCKLVLSFVCGLYPESKICTYTEGHGAETAISLITVGVFFIPLLTSLLFNFPARNKK